MKNLYLISLLLIIGFYQRVQAEGIYSDPVTIQENTKGIKVFFDASDSPLANKPATFKVYAHTGVYTNLSPEDWVYTTGWGTSSDTQKYQLTYQGPNLWMLYIEDIRDFYGIKNANEQVTSLNFVFKAAGTDGIPQSSDLKLKVLDNGLQIQLRSDSNSEIITGETGYVTFTVNTTEPAAISLSVDGSSIASANNAMELEKDYTFTTPGEHTVTATATANGKTVSESMTYHYLRASSQMNYPGGTPKMGPVTNGNGVVTFCIGAPEKKHVVLVGSWNNYAYDTTQVMNYQDTETGRYFWVNVAGLNPNEKYVYYYIVDGGEYIVGDPYARLVLDPYNDKYIDTSAFNGLPQYPTEALKGQNVPVAIYWENINNYDWEVENFKIPVKTDLIIYELLLRDFTGTEGKAEGNGTVKLALEKIPYLKTLGINAIELLPIMEFNGNNSWGYNPNFYFAVDKAYGTPDDYKEFIDVCHQNGIAVILDMVFNQSDGWHPWFQMYQPGKNPFYNLTAPHDYSVLNDWRQDYAMVQEQWADVLRYWMTEYKFDGFRFDLVKGLGLNTSYPNNGAAATNQYNASRVEEMRSLQKVMNEINPDAIFINENLAFAKEENEMAESGQQNWANMNDAGCQYAMGYSERSNLNPMYAPNNDNRLWGSTVSYLESHDEQRLAYKQDQYASADIKGNPKTSCQRLGSTAAQMIMVPGAHMIWQFSEMGNAENTKKSDNGNITDPKVVNWSLLDEPNHRGLYQNYCELIGVRLSNPEMFAEDAEFTMGCNVGNWNTGRYIFSKKDGKELLTFINPDTNPSGSLTMNYSFANKDNAAYKIISQSYGSAPSFNAETGTVTVPANCYVVIGSSELHTGVESIEVDENKNILRVYGGYGEVVVDYAPDGASIYSLDGKFVGRVKDSGRIPASAGLYIVKSGRQQQKVLVR